MSKKSIEPKMQMGMCYVCADSVHLIKWLVLWMKAVSESEQSLNMMRQEVWLQIAPLFQRRVLEAAVRRDFYSAFYSSVHSRSVQLYLAVQQHLVCPVHSNVAHVHFQFMFCVLHPVFHSRLVQFYNIDS